MYVHLNLLTIGHVDDEEDDNKGVDDLIEPVQAARFKPTDSSNVN